MMLEIKKNVYIHKHNQSIKAKVIRVQKVFYFQSDSAIHITNFQHISQWFRITTLL